MGGVVAQSNAPIGEGTAYDGNLYHTGGNLGIGIRTPQKLLHIYSMYNLSSGPELSAIRLQNKEMNNKGPGPGTSYHYLWDIENSGFSLNLKYKKYEVSCTGCDTIPSTKFSFSENGTLTATKFIGDGSGLTNVGFWEENNGNIYYNNGNAGIGTSNPSAMFTIHGEEDDIAPIIETGGQILLETEYEGVGKEWFTNKYKLLNTGYKLEILRTTDQEEYSTLVSFAGNSTNFEGGLYAANIKFHVSENKMTYTGGNVGIGTAYPNSLLEIYNNSYGSWNTPFIKIKKPADSDLAAIGIETNQQHWVIAAINSSSGNEGFWIKDQKNGIIPFRITNDGIVVINDKLWVKNEVAVQWNDPWPDYVFKNNYNLMPLKQLKNYIKENGHLPNIPTSEDVKKEGIKLAENQALMLQKIEELTLYIINLKEDNDKLKDRIVELENR